MTQPALENRVFLDWFKAHSRDSLRRYLVSSSGSASDLLEFLSPFSASYHSPLNPVFLAECENLKQLDYASTWLARDGLVPLLWFFSRFPEPRNFKGRIYLPADLVGLAPQTWRARMGAYRFGELPASQRPRGFIENRAKVTRLILLGINAPSYCGPEKLEELLGGARKRFVARFGAPPREIVACLIQKTEPLGTADRASRHANETMLSICRALGTRVKVMDLRDFELGWSFNGSAVLELNECLLCADSSLIHAAVGRGALLLDSPLRARGAKYVRTTLTHGFELHDRPKPASENIQAKVDRALVSTANRSFPWQFWSEREADRERVFDSPVTGVDRAIESDQRRYNVLVGHPQCSLDVVYLGTDKLEVHGWCSDPVHDRAPVDVMVLRGSKRLLGTLTRTVRADVQREQGRRFDENFRPGFEFQLPRSALKDIRPKEVFSAYCLFGHDLAIQVGQFRLNQRNNRVDRLPARNRAVGTYMTARVQKDHVDLFPLGDARPVSYAISESGGHYQARLDYATSDDGELKVVGWAADLLRSAPAEAVIVFGGGDYALVFPVLERRPDVAKAMDRLEISGFTIKAPWVRPRVFVTFESGVAIEVRVPVASGSA